MVWENSGVLSIELKNKLELESGCFRDMAPFLWSIMFRQLQEGWRLFKEKKIHDLKKGLTWFLVGNVLRNFIELWDKLRLKVTIRMDITAAYLLWLLLHWRLPIGRDREGGVGYNAAHLKACLHRSMCQNFNCTFKYIYIYIFIPRLFSTPSTLRGTLHVERSVHLHGPSPTSGGE